MAGTDSTEVLECLHPLRNAASPEFFRVQSHRLGHLWQVTDLHRDRPHNPYNSDRHQLLFHVAALDCPNRKALERMLAKQPRWEPDGESADDWVWLRPRHRVSATEESDAKMFGTHAQGPSGMATVLAQLEIDGKHLTLRTNSRKRYNLACATLTTLRGVDLKSVQTYAPEGDGGSTPDAEEVSGQSIGLAPEDIEVLRDYSLQYQRQWLDQPIPSLSDHTPRQTATQPGLRTQLAAMIRAIPDPTDLGTTGLTLYAPRQMLLSELGLHHEPNQ